jgi:hypothetical protein
LIARYWCEDYPTVTCLPVAVGKHGYGTAAVIARVLQNSKIDLMLASGATFRRTATLSLINERDMTAG